MTMACIKRFYLFARASNITKETLYNNAHLSCPYAVHDVMIRGTWRWFDVWNSNRTVHWKQLYSCYTINISETTKNQVRPKRNALNFSMGNVNLYSWTALYCPHTPIFCTFAWQTNELFLYNIPCRTIFPSFFDTICSKQQTFASPSFSDSGAYQWMTINRWNARRCFNLSQSLPPIGNRQKSSIPLRFLGKSRLYCETKNGIRFEVKCRILQFVWTIQM